MIPNETDVVIVGAGPTGLALAVSLQQAGIPHVIVDRLESGLHTSRAAVVHAHTLDVLERIGVARELRARGLRVEQFNIRERDRSLLRLEFGRLPARHPYLLMVPQDVTEEVLAHRLSQLGGQVHRGVTVTGVIQDADRATVTLVAGGEPRQVTAKYVVGGDGMHSIVRKAAGIDFAGATYEASFVLADVRMAWSLGHDEVSLFFSPAGLVVVAPLPDGAFRIVATVDEAPEQPSLADIQALIDERGPTNSRNPVVDVVWSSRFRVHHRIAASYRNGRLMLMGDAAHVHSPAGGQGMNTGLVDAVVLGELLEGVLTGARSESALDAYETLRRPAARQVLALAHRLTAMATARGRITRVVRNRALSMLGRVPGVRRQIMLNLSGLGRSRMAELSRLTLT